MLRWCLDHGRNGLIVATDGAKRLPGGAGVKGRIERDQVFQDDATAGQLNLFGVSNWKSVIFAGIPISMLTVLYLLGLILTVVRWVFPKGRQMSAEV